MTTLYVFTSTFPYGDGETFFVTELNYLAQEFERVMIFPSRIIGQPQKVPKNAYVEDGLAHTRQTGWRRAWQSVHASILTSSFYHEWRKHPQSIFHPKGFARLISHLGDTQRVYQYMLTHLQHVDMNEAVFYTYWLGRPTLALGWLKREYPHLKVISRGHGGDIYRERYQPSYLPLQDQTIVSLDQLYLISQHGKDTITRQYPHMQHKFSLARLGAMPSQHQTPASTDGVVRIVSCSSMIPLKRIDRIMDALQALAKHLPNQQVQWWHIGDGALRNELEQRAASLLPEISWEFIGQMPHQELLHFYETRPVDVFINTSDSEGIPVTIMEAQSRGIPVIAPNVGGIPEIVNDRNGYLFPQPASADEIAMGILQILQAGEALRQASFADWEADYNAAHNYAEFARELRNWADASSILPR